MKSKRQSSRHLAAYLQLLVDRLHRWEPDRASAIHRLVAGRRARIVLDNEAAVIYFTGQRFVARKASVSPNMKAPYGLTDRPTVVAILAGFLELSEAIADGRLDLRGTTNDVIDMCAAIEVLIDASTRIPELQALARDFRNDPKTGPFKARRGLSEHRALIKQVAEAEVALLRRYRLTV
jgi:hypothetical protein